MTEQSIDTPPVDLDLIEADLRDVESVLARLADGTYFSRPLEPAPGTDIADDPDVPTAEEVAG